MHELWRRRPASSLPRELPLQENLVAARVPREVQHGLLPRYFSAFSEEEGAYLPSPLLREAYPHDF